MSDEIKSFLAYCDAVKAREQRDRIQEQELRQKANYYIKRIDDLLTADLPGRWQLNALDITLSKEIERLLKRVKEASLWYNSVSHVWPGLIDLLTGLAGQVQAVHENLPAIVQLMNLRAQLQPMFNDLLSNAAEYISQTQGFPSSGGSSMEFHGMFIPAPHGIRGQVERSRSAESTCTRHIPVLKALAGYCWQVRSKMDYEQIEFSLGFGGSMEPTSRFRKRWVQSKSIGYALFWPSNCYGNELVNPPPIYIVIASPFLMNEEHLSKDARAILWAEPVILYEHLDDLTYAGIYGTSMVDLFDPQTGRLRKNARVFREQDVSEYQKWLLDVIESFIRQPATSEDYITW